MNEKTMGAIPVSALERLEQSAVKLSLITFCLRHEELKAAPDAAEIHSIKSDLSRALREVSTNAAACALTGGIPEKAKASPPAGAEPKRIQRKEIPKGTAYGVLRLRCPKCGDEYLFLLEKYPQYPGMVYAIIDDTGLGGGVTDILRHEKEARRLNQLEVIPVNFGASVPQEDAAANYADISTWMWSLVRDMAQSGRLHLPNDTELIAQLSTRKYAFAGTPPKLKLESKEIMKRRGLPSPDRADAVALSLYQPVTYTWEIG